MSKEKIEYWNGYRDENEEEIILNTAQEMEDTIEKITNEWDDERDIGFEPVSKRDKIRMFIELAYMKLEDPSQPLVVTKGIIKAMICQIC